MTLIEQVRLSRSLPPRGLAAAIRRSAGVSRESLAEELGIHPVTVARWEQGSRTPRGKLRVRYAQLLAELAAEVSH